MRSGRCLLQGLAITVLATASSHAATTGSAGAGEPMDTVQPSLGLQVLIAAPTEKRSVVYENLDTVIDVFRHGDTASAEVVRIKSHARTQMRAANPQHLSDASLAALLDAPASDAAE